MLEVLWVLCSVHYRSSGITGTQHQQHSTTPTPAAPRKNPVIPAAALQLPDKLSVITP